MRTIIRCSILALVLVSGAMLGCTSKDVQTKPQGESAEGDQVRNQARQMLESTRLSPEQIKQLQSGAGGQQQQQQ